MQRVSNIIPYFRNELAPLFDDREVVNWAYLSIEHLIGYNRVDCIINTNNYITIIVSDKLKQIIIKLKTKKPIQYILGETHFYGLKIAIDKHTLIPRPETEELVDWILKEDFNCALDLGTGSGCIAISLAKHSNASISAMDISENALQVAKQNALLNNVKVDFTQIDIFEMVSLKKFDLIVSNPPYVLNSEKEKMNDNVLDYEPHLALFVSDSAPLIFYKKIINIAIESLVSGGKLFFEINEQFACEIISMLNNSGFVDIELKKDINERDRMIKAIWK